MRTITIVNVGKGKNERPFAQARVQLTSEEQLMALAIARETGAKFGPVMTGILNGVSESDLSKLAVGQQFECEGLAVRMRAGTYTKEGEEIASINVTLDLESATTVSEIARKTATIRFLKTKA